VTDTPKASTVPVTVRALTPADHSVWFPLWQGYLTFYQTTLSEDVIRTTWSRLLDPTEPMHGALAYAEGDVPVGLVHWLTHRSCWTIGDYCYLQDLFVTEGARGGGFGRRLIEHVYREAAAVGCSRVYWLTHETNHHAMLLYDRVADRSGFLQYRKLFSS
jgi:GNAT superfamily N-acetyltransferase